MLVFATIIPRLLPDPFPYTLIVDPLTALNEKVFAPSVPVPSNMTPYKLFDDVYGMVALDKETTLVRSFEVTVVVPP